MARRNHLAGIRAHAAALCAFVSLLGWAGCSRGPAAIPPVNVDVDRVVEQLLSEYDKDQSGGLSPEELSVSPPLAQSLSGFRQDQDDEISAQRLTKELHRIFDPQSALVSASCVVKRNGQPLSGAEVRFVPLPVLQDELPVGSGATDSDGTAMISPPREELPAEAPNVPLMPPGLYLVEITHPTVTIPEKYNSKTILGKEVSSESVYRGGLAIDLKL